MLLTHIRVEPIISIGNTVSIAAIIGNVFVQSWNTLYTQPIKIYFGSDCEILCESLYVRNYSDHLMNVIIKVMIEDVLMESKSLTRISSNLSYMWLTHLSI